MGDNIRIISADSHVSIPNELVQSHLPSKLREKVIETEKAYAEAMLAAKPQKAAQAELKKERQSSGEDRAFPNMGAGAPWPAAGRAGEHDAVARLADMDLDGVEAEVLYVGAGGASLMALDPTDMVEAIRAINSASIEWASVDPKRLMPVYILPINDIDASVKEVERVVAEHGKAVQVPLIPREQGAPPYWDEYYDPLWDVISETGVPISQHVGANRYLMADVMSEDPTPFMGIMQSLPPIFMSECVADWTVSGVLERWPRLKVVLVEAGIGWIPYFLERLDTMVDNHGWDTFPGKAISEKPSFYWHRNMAATFEQDLAGIRLLDLIGIENLMWATDYPHPDSTWPRSQEILTTHFQDLPKDEIEMIASGNVTRLYNL
ncbi:MAG TPA: amidohydrolase family protein [Acidimicrobiia bacterium]|nr:amidohydrolase family protein [Acidimicrobiia bacterium]